MKKNLSIGNLLPHLQQEYHRCMERLNEDARRVFLLFMENRGNKVRQTELELAKWLTNDPHNYRIKALEKILCGGDPRWKQAKRWHGNLQIILERAEKTLSRIEYGTIKYHKDRPLLRNHRGCGARAFH
jgi:hypothetical protein